MDKQEETIIKRDIENEMKTAYIDYAMSVIVARALPDVRDGMKPVHRRILYTMHEDGITPDKPYRKCATTVGDVLGRYHPHGDASVYDALVRMAQDFSMRYMMVDRTWMFSMQSLQLRSSTHLVQISLDLQCPRDMRHLLTNLRLNRIFSPDTMC